MCGIFLYLGSQRDADSLAAEFLKIRPRGPDNSHFFTEKNVFIGFHRLMINDLTYNGNQPFWIDETMLVCNGEIYNFKALQAEHQLPCHSGSDCEVVLHLYNKLKNNSPNIEEVVTRLCNMLDGEFAFIIYDKELQKIVAARDRYGVRPLFIGVNMERYELGLCSELKGIDKLFDQVEQFLPSCYAIFDTTNMGENMYDTYNNISEPYDIMNDNIGSILPAIKNTVETAVLKRLVSDVPVCALLSGGLDSSLVCAIVARQLGPGKLHTFSIGMEGSTDLHYARLVAKHIGSTHHEVLVTEAEMLAAIEEVIRVTETYDITTVRASTPHYLLSKHIRKNTPFRVVLSGEMSDEANGSYMYFKKAPSVIDYHAEVNRLLEEVCYFDNLRADRSISANGLEARVPFSDHNYVKLIQSIHPSLRMCDGKIEKYLLRKAFDGTGLLSDEVLWRSKEGFSDGVSKVENSWYKIIQEHIDTLVSDDEFTKQAKKYTHCTPKTKEAYYYRKTFCRFYKNDNVIPHFWMPRWCGQVLDPSARELTEIYST